MGRAFRLAFPLVAAFALAYAGQETPALHTGRPSKTILLDNQTIRPADLTMGSGDLLVFENHSLHPIQVTFQEPKDLRDRIRCQLLQGKADDKERAPWMLFGWNDGQLTGIIPPGRFASICSLTPGRYSFTAARKAAIIRDPGQGGDLPEKGQITVQ